MSKKREVRCVCEFANLLVALADERKKGEGFGDDPCKDIRDALDIRRAATQLLSDALALSQAIEMQLEVDLTTCEMNNS